VTRPFAVPDRADPTEVEDLVVLLRGRRLDLLQAYQALEDSCRGGSPRIITWRSGSTNEFAIRSSRPGL
jgi:hypothetical protein